ncbi:hypothetical protein J4Q44_G00046890 [Coregonus suidteri]|uniref:Uncharacterized protein n=1 Tax=Coregonus suidteri TaxID=861788 RepID=A0AAN8MEM9_9TELE
MLEETVLSRSLCSPHPPQPLLERKGEREGRVQLKSKQACRQPTHKVSHRLFVDFFAGPDAVRGGCVQLPWAGLKAEEAGCCGSPCCLWWSWGV